MFDLPYRSIPGVVSEVALAQHVELWRGYEGRANGGGGSYDVAGALLHALFFRQLTDKPKLLGGPGPRFATTVSVKWGSTALWWQAMREVAMQAHGWAITAVRGDDLRIFGLEAHDDGGVIGYEPLVVIDVMEHSYWADFGTRKDLYVTALFGAFDWAEIDRRLDLKDCGERVP